MSGYTTPFRGDNPPPFPDPDQVWIDTSGEDAVTEVLKRTIWKFPLAFTPTLINISVPGAMESKPLALQYQYGVPTLWVEVAPGRGTTDWELCWVATGGEVPKNFSYIGTLQVEPEWNSEPLVFHLYGRYVT